MFSMECRKEDSQAARLGPRVHLLFSRGQQHTTYTRRYWKEVGPNRGELDDSPGFSDFVQTMYIVLLIILTWVLGWNNIELKKIHCLDWLTLFLLTFLLWQENLKFYVWLSFYFCWIVLALDDWPEERLSTLAYFTKG